jgi:hypothetical protein
VLASSVKPATDARTLSRLIGAFFLYLANAGN